MSEALLPFVVNNGNSAITAQNLQPDRALCERSASEEVDQGRGPGLGWRRVSRHYHQYASNLRRGSIDIERHDVNENCLFDKTRQSNLIPAGPDLRVRTLIHSPVWRGPQPTMFRTHLVPLVRLWLLWISRLFWQRKPEEKSLANLPFNLSEYEIITSYLDETGDMWESGKELNLKFKRIVVICYKI
ncbi:hypothetical protein DBV15_04518 [Temnothorax longispinosus]|uniref:Uncharacterized protein n=1 Tax=Temnothorax longispinosus TaxID=300112 RepID=A0A4S2KH94_9HYME|nr:hypothetical protein DBV15_04518 [Temnothorax longispinosus]